MVNQDMLIYNVTASNGGGFFGAFVAYAGIEKEQQQLRTKLKMTGLTAALTPISLPLC